MLHGRGVNFIIFAMCADKLDPTNLAAIVEGHNETIMIALDIEYHTIIGNDPQRPTSNHFFLSKATLSPK